MFSHKLNIFGWSIAILIVMLTLSGCTTQDEPVNNVYTPQVQGVNDNVKTEEGQEEKEEAERCRKVLESYEKQEYSLIKQDTDALQVSDSCYITARQLLRSLERELELQEAKTTAQAFIRESYKKDRENSLNEWKKLLEGSNKKIKEAQERIDALDSKVEPKKNNIDTYSRPEPQAPIKLYDFKKNTDSDHGTNLDLNKEPEVQRDDDLYDDIYDDYLSDYTTPDTSSCCKVCSKGKACGDSCISRSKTCHKAYGCACDAY